MARTVTREMPDKLPGDKWPASLGNFAQVPVDRPLVAPDGPTDDPDAPMTWALPLAAQTVSETRLPGKVKPPAWHAFTGFMLMTGSALFMSGIALMIAGSVGHTAFVTLIGLALLVLAAALMVAGFSTQRFGRGPIVTITTPEDSK
jgi:cytochrome bd-type quinol oxidase subunit 1